MDGAGTGTRANRNGNRLPNLGTVRAITSSWCGLSTDTGTVYRYRWAWFTSRALVTGGTRVRATLGVCQVDSCTLLGALLPRGPAHWQIRHQGTHLAQFVDASSLAADPQTARPRHSSVAADSLYADDLLGWTEAVGTTRVHRAGTLFFTGCVAFRAQALSTGKSTDFSGSNS